MGTHDTFAYDQQASELLARRAELLREPETVLPTRLYNIFNAKKLELIEKELRDNKGRLADMLVIGLSAEKAQEVCNALGYRHDNKKYEAVNALGLVRDIQRSDYSGSRGYGRNVSKGYFKATSEELGDVLLYRGTYEGYEQAALVDYMGSLTQEVRALYPEIYGTYVEEGETYLVMEKFGNCLDSRSLTVEDFLRECGQYLQPSFAREISLIGLNIGRTTLEYDYVFHDETGAIRLGIPYRALGFVQDSQERMLCASAFKQEQQQVGVVAKVDVQPF